MYAYPRSHSRRHSDLQDNFTAQWDYATIAEVVRPYVVENDITTVRHAATSEASSSRLTYAYDTRRS